MPQPIRKKCHAEVSGLSQRPQHAAVLGHIVGISGRLENALGGLLALLSRGSALITIPMFHAVSSTDAQRAMLLAAADQSLRGVECDAFHELMGDFRQRYGERSKLVHNLWGHSNDHPDKALWWQSADVGLTIAKIAAAPSMATMTQIAQEEELSLQAMAYTVKDLQDVATRLAEYTDRVVAFTGELWNAHPAVVAAAIASTNAPPMGESPQLDLQQSPQTAPGSDQPGG
jgi:hypothetical protein